jgi:hypothetical protein
VIVLDTLRDAALTFGAGSSGELKINSRVVDGGLVDSKIPDTQWITEIVNWESFIMAGFQIAISDYAIGPQLRTPEDLNMTKPTYPGQLELCNAQRMRKSGGFV